MFPARIRHNYGDIPLPPNFIKRDLFGFYRINGQIGVYVDDDGDYLLQHCFDETWLPELHALILAYDEKFPVLKRKK